MERRAAPPVQLAPSFVDDSRGPVVSRQASRPDMLISLQNTIPSSTTNALEQSRQQQHDLSTTHVELAEIRRRRHAREFADMISPINQTGNAQFDNEQVLQQHAAVAGARPPIQADSPSCVIWFEAY